LPMGGNGIASAYQMGLGGSWTPAPLPPPAGPMSKWVAGPVVSLNQKGMVWVFSGLFTPTGSTSFDGIAGCHGTFRVGGVGWCAPSVARMGTPGEALIDKPWLAADSSNAKLYLAYVSFGMGTDSILFQKSADGGVSWSDPLTIATATPALLQGPRVA